MEHFITSSLGWHLVPSLVIWPNQRIVHVLPLAFHGSLLNSAIVIDWSKIFIDRVIDL